MNEHFFEERGLYYRTNEFQPNRPTLVFIHGLSGSSSAWAPYERHFEGRFNVVTYDLRGHGNSRKPRWYTDYAMRYFTEDLEALVQHLQIEKFILIAHSFAVLFALEYLATHPTAVTGAVLLSPAPDMGKRFAERVLKILLTPTPLLQYFPFSGEPRGRVDYVLHPQSGDRDMRALLRDVTNTGFRVYFYCSKQLFGIDHTSILEKLPMPVLLMHGKKDRFLPFKGSEKMAKEIPHARLIAIENADHILVHNFVPDVCAGIDDFLREIK